MLLNRVLCPGGDEDCHKHHPQAFVAVDVQGLQVHEQPPSRQGPQQSPIDAPDGAAAAQLSVIEQYKLGWSSWCTGGCQAEETVVWLT